jgi:ABC-type glycerol-3-phosphate transport system substrate-binding protein
MLRKVLVLSLLVLTLGFVLQVYGSAEVPTLTVMQNWPKGFGDRTPEYEDQFWTRAERELGIKIEMVYAPSHDDYLSKLPVMAASGTAPDVVLYAAAAHWSLGLFEPLTQYVQKSGFPIREFLPAAVEHWTADGQLYAIPTSRNHEMFVYDVDAFAQAGIPAPPTKWADPSWNWDYIRTIAKKLTKSDGNQIARYGLSGFGTAEAWPAYWGGDWVDAQNNIAIDTELNRRALEYFADFAKEQRLGGDINAGTASMSNGMSWAVNTYVASGRNLAFAPTPMGSRAATISYIDGAAIMRSSKNKDLAWRFMEWLFEPENAVGFFSVQWNYLVPLRSVRRPWEDQLYIRLGDVIFTSNYAEVLYEAGAYGYRSKLFTDPKFTALWPNITSWGDENVLFGANHRKVMAGEMSATSYLAEAQRLLTNMLAEASTKR